MDMFKSGANNTPETLTAVGGGGSSRKGKDQSILSRWRGQNFCIFTGVEMREILGEVQSYQLRK